MVIPTDRRYSESHQWARLDGDRMTVGITDYAQELLGDVVFVEVPALGRKLKMGEQCAVVESVKSASEIYAPVSGEVSEVNSELDASPEKINQNAHAAWIFKIKPADLSELGKLLDAEAYRKLIGTPM